MRSLGDARCKLLIENLPALASLNISTYATNKDLNNLSNLAAHSLLALEQLEELNISTQISMQVTIASVMREHNFWRGCLC